MNDSKNLVFLSFFDVFLITFSTTAQCSSRFFCSFFDSRDFKKTLLLCINMKPLNIIWWEMWAITQTTCFWTTVLRACSYDPAYRDVSLIIPRRIFPCVHMEYFVPLAEMKLHCSSIISVCKTSTFQSSNTNT